MIDVADVHHDYALEREGVPMPFNDVASWYGN